MKKENSICSYTRKILLIAILLTAFVIAPISQGSINAILQTYDGGSAAFVTTNTVALSTNSLFMVYLSTNTGGAGFNPHAPAVPAYGDIVLGAYPLAGNGMPGFAGQITGYPSVSYTNAGTGDIYYAVFDYAYSDYALSNTVPIGTHYLLTTNEMVVAREASGGGLLTDVGGALQSYATLNGPWVASEMLPGPEQAAIGLSTQLVAFSTTYGANPANINFILANTGALGMQFTNQLSYGAGASGWLSVAPSSGSLNSGQNTSVGCAVNVSGVNAGNYTAAVAVVSAEATNSPQIVAVTLAVAKADQSINFGPIESQEVTNVLALSATASSGLPIFYAVIDGPGVVNGSSLSFTATGVVLVTASQSGNINWNLAATVTQSVEVVSLPPVGYLTGMIQPEIPRSEGRWRVAGQSTWRTSGTKVSLSPGSYSLEFNTVPGWTTPASIGVVVYAGQSSTKTGTYVIHKVRNDFDGDGISDIGCYEPVLGYWYIYKSSIRDIWVTNYAGGTGTLPVTGDFDGDDICDYGTFYPPNGLWNIMRSRDGEWQNNFGYVGTVPVTGDMDGDGILDFGCYYANSGWWYIYKSFSGFWTTQFGYGGTVPVTGDFDGDGIDDFGCYYAPEGWWYIFKSSISDIWTTQFGYGGTIPVTGDFDGDGIDDFGCYYPQGGNWYLYLSRDGFETKTFGYEGTVPITGDYDGDGITDYGCYYAPSGNWHVFMSSTQEIWLNEFGYDGTLPLK